MAFKIGLFATAVACATASSAGELSAQAHSMLQRAKKQGITGTPGVSSMFSGMVTNLESALPLIKQNHNLTQVKLDTGIGNAQRDEVAANQSKALADAKDKNWYDCVEEQRDLQQRWENQMIEVSKFTEQAATYCLAANNTKQSTRVLQDVSRQISCTMGSIADSCEEAVQTWNSSVIRSMKNLLELVRGDVDIWQQNHEECGKFSQKTRDAIESAAAIRSNYSTKVTECHGLFQTTKSSFCDFTSAWRSSCDSKQAYSQLLQAVNKEEGGDLSIPDRQEEWQQVRNSLCELNNFLNNATSRCGDFNLESEVGTINQHRTEFDQLNDFTCEETMFTFYGFQWEVPVVLAGEFANASEYVHKEKHFTLTGLSTFTFCPA